MLERIEKVLQEKRGNSSLKISAQTSLADLGLDSLDMAELVMELEDEFAITLESNAPIKTVGDLMTQIQLKISE
jgi:acyl carrier protein